MPTWSNLANNRYISTNNILQGVISGSISLFTGNTLTFSNQPNQWVDKLSFSNSIPHGTLSTTFNNKLDNQWITKNDIIPGMECPCDYSITYSTGISNYNCYNLTNALSPLYTKTAQRVSSGSWNNSTWVSMNTLPRLYSTYDNKGVGVYETFGIYSNGTRNSTWINASNFIDGRMNATAVWVKDNFITITSDTYVNGYYTNSTPVLYTNANSIWVPVDKWIGFVYSFTVSVSKMYYIGINGDNLVKVSYNGITILDNSHSSPDYTGVFTQWCIYPLDLNSGVYTFNFSVLNARRVGSIAENPAGFSAELYDFTGLTDSTYTTLSSALTNNISSTASLDPYILFSTKDMDGINWSIGEDFAYSCPIYPDSTLLPPDQNGIYSCLITQPQTNYALGCQDYITMIVGITQSILFNLSITSYEFTSQYLTIDFGDDTPLFYTGDIAFTYSSSNIPPYTGSTLSGATWLNFPSNLNPPMFGDNVVNYNYYYPGSYTTMIFYAHANGECTLLLYHKYTKIGSLQIKIYPSSNSSSSKFGLQSNNGVIRYLTCTNNFKPKVALGLDSNLLLDLTQNINKSLWYNMTKYFDVNKMIFSGNRLTNYDPPIPFIIDELPYNMSSTTLALNSNLLTNYDPKYPNNFNSLDLSYNLITYFNPKKNPLTTTTYYNGTLNISNNRITSVLGMSYSFPNYLNYLLYNNPITIFNPYTIVGGISQSIFTQSGALGPSYSQYGQYINLNLNNCLLTSFDPDFQLSNNLQILNLSVNKLTTFNPRIIPSLELKYLVLSYNKLTSIPYNFILYTKLTDLDLSSNFLGTPSNTFTGPLLPTNLSTLNLSSNLFNNIDTSIFSNVKGLTNLYLNDCNNHLNINYDIYNIPFTSSNSYLNISSARYNNVSATISCTFSNNLSSIKIGIGGLVIFNPPSLPTNLKILNISQQGNYQPQPMEIYNFDFNLLHNTSINTFSILGHHLTSASATYPLPSSLVSFSLCGIGYIPGGSTVIYQITPLTNIDYTNLLPSSVKNINLSYNSFTSSVLENILIYLDSTGSTGGSINLYKQYGITNSITPIMTTHLNSLFSKSWTYSI